MNKSNFSHAYSLCRVCPHECNVDRSRQPAGFCRCGTEAAVAAICCHKGEEPVISGKRGICNVFFAHCNLQCIYCQNHEISNNRSVAARLMSVDEIAREIIRLLPDCENRVGFVSASQFVPHVVAIVETVHSLGVHPVFVYNSNGYDHPEMLRLLEGKIDVYLPDFKYSDSLLAKRLSGVDDYPQVAIRAIREMYRQKGSPLWLDDNGLAESGLIIRHLLLPGMVQQSIEALRMVAEEISASVHISLMSQYYPPVEIPAFPELNRMLREEEYLTVTNAFCQLGFHKGWMQELGSDEHFRPHFDKDNPFPNL